MKNTFLAYKEGTVYSRLNNGKNRKFSCKFPNSKIFLLLYVQHVVKTHTPNIFCLQYTFTDLRS